MKTYEREFHDRLYKEVLHPRKEVMRLYEVASRARERFYQLLLERVKPGIRVLEYGCGAGSSAWFLVERGAQVIGIDISKEAIKQAQTEASRKGVAERVSFVEMDAETLGFSHNSFDIVCGVSILHHLDCIKAYEEINRVLRPSGYAVF